MSAYEMAATVEFGLDAKQGLLDLRSETARLKLVARLLRAAVKRLDFVERARPARGRTARSASRLSARASGRAPRRRRSRASSSRSSSAGKARSRRISASSSRSASSASICASAASVRWSGWPPACSSRSRRRSSRAS